MTNSNYTNEEISISSNSPELENFTQYCESKGFTVVSDTNENSPEAGWLWDEYCNQ